MLHGEGVNSFGVGAQFINDAMGFFDNQLPAVLQGAKMSAGGLAMSSELLKSIKQQIASLPLPEKEQLAAFLSEQLRQTNEQASITNVTGSDDIRQRRTEGIIAHREEYAGQYVALEGDSLVGAGRTIREAHEQAKEKGFKNPFLVRITSEHETLSAGW